MPTPTKDERNWTVVATFLNKDDCPYVYYPCSYHACELLPEENNACTYENCIRKGACGFGVKE